jgi:excinuclease ABC subunit A
MGPEAGDAGGQVVAEGTPEWVAGMAGTATIGHTGRALLPFLERGPHAERPVHDPAASDAMGPEDLDVTDVGRDAKMPWETDGLRWHTHDRVGRSGAACRWDGEILRRVVERIQDLGTFGPTNWNSRSVVEIAAERKSDGWFFHALTGETWLLKLKFRVSRGAFNPRDLVEQLNLKTLNEMDDLPIYGNEPRVRCRHAGGPWQEVQINAHRLDEIDTPAFWQFLESAVAAFERHTQRVASNPDELMPWKKLGQKWHFMRKGFPPGKTIAWPTQVLEELTTLLATVAPDGQYLWNNQQVVHLMVPAQRDPWATIWTKRPQDLLLTLNGPKGSVALGRIAALGRDRSLDAGREERDVVKLTFRRPGDLQRGGLEEFLREHLETVTTNRTT